MLECASICIEQGSSAFLESGHCSNFFKNLVASVDETTIVLSVSAYFRGSQSGAAISTR